ncbi:LuxR family transcriptional regulator [Flavobacterium sp. NRK F10]|uniref:helix-turn-helix and ligand-binding sensor domain-containing protein n=1 Tax=Flavobacterium sp. NRK F10 TaxID=2954931 RepID=UPI00209191CD|nr:LuxR C-terminal-related transcriptional regulator [Flavobacterium sp. NRK F10]MCO6175790.1 LuxR family transcriptional regulator [Flavobacterium sp. NRK F10]
MKLHFFILIFFFQHFLFSQETLPFVENFSKQDYNGDNQVWSVSQGDDNALYFANNSFLIRYDGVKWEKYTLPNKTIIRSVLAFQGKVFTGSYNEFGFWVRENGVMKYTSLSADKDFFEGNTRSEEVWKIFSLNKKIYFQTFNELYIYDSEKIVKKNFPYQISYCFVVRDRLFAATVHKGIYEFLGGEFDKVAGLEPIEDNIIYGIDAYKNQNFFFTQKNGVFVQNVNEELLAWNHPINEKLKTQIIITAKVFKAKVLIGTAFNGIYVVDLTSNEYFNINRSNSLRNNSVLSISVDKEQDVWLGLDNGISHIILNSPYQIFSDHSGQLGTVYSLASYGEGYLLGTNHGVFESKDNKLTLIPNSQGQVWDIEKVDDKYVIGHNEGTFEYSENKGYRKLNDLTGGWNFKKDKFANRYIQANYTGLYLFPDPNDFSVYKKINDKMKPIKDFVQVGPKAFVLADSYRGLYKVELNEKDEPEKITNITQLNEIQNDFGVKLFHYKNAELYYIDNVWYFLESISNKLIPNEVFNANFKNIQEIISLDEDDFIVNKDGKLFIINNVDNNFIWVPIPQEYYLGKLINNETKVYKKEGKYLLNTDDGFLQINSLRSQFAKQNVKIELASSNNTFLREGGSVGFKEQLKLYVISEYYGSKKTPLYYKIDDEALVPLEKGVVELKNLVSDSHSISVYYNDGEKFVEASKFSFKVSDPWYFSIWMKLVYVLIIASLLLLYYKWTKYKYYQKLKLKEEELKHKNEILRLEIEADNKLKLQEYEKHILENQVQAKANELASKSLSIVKQGELIDSIQKILDSEKNITSLKAKISKAIKINALNKNEWKSFEENLLKSNEDFVKQLTLKHQNLTSKDIKLCIYLKMNLSSKEIAPLMNISYRGVELHRYRLRKKMDLDSSVNLNLFMNNIK